MRQTKSRVTKVLFIALKITLAVLLVWWLWHSGKLDWHIIAGVRPGWALAGVVIFQVSLILSLCWRWHLLLKSAGTPLSFGSALIITLKAQCISTFTPGSIGIDGMRFYQLYKIFPEQRAAASVSIVWDRLIGIGMLLLLTVICNSILLLSPLQETLKSTFTLILICSAALLALPLTLLFPHNPLRRLRQWKLLRNIPLPQSNKSTFMLPAGISCGTHLCNALAILCAFYAVGDPVPIGRGLLLMPLVILSGMLPLTPLGIGVTEAVTLMIFSSITTGSGANAIMLSRISFVLISALCGLAWFLPFHQNSTPTNKK